MATIAAFLSSSRSALKSDLPRKFTGRGNGGPWQLCAPSNDDLLGLKIGFTAYEPLNQQERSKLPCPLNH